MDNPEPASSPCQAPPGHWGEDVEKRADASPENERCPEQAPAPEGSGETEPESESAAGQT